MALRSALIGTTLVAVPLVGLVGLRPALAENSSTCGAVTGSPMCAQAAGQAAPSGALYQVSHTVSSSDGNVAVVCDGGPTANDRDTALADNFWQYLIAFTSAPGKVAQVTDSAGRLVGYSIKGDLGLGVTDFTLFVTCVDDHLPPQ
jgi:hypothetical protein